ncbi:MAG: hypothetical protein JNK54_10725, partial [Elusimicrobia bacterium]|nr:hypothetical protein [Elusimicrobiota bacterium]
MKGWTIVCSLLVAVAAVSLRAADRRVNYFGQLEYLTYSDAFEKNEKKFRDDLLEAYGSDGIVSGSNETKGGAGARIGA